jgi:hypothetical protein
MVWFVVAMYLVIPALGLVCLWLTYQIHVKHRFTLIRDYQRKPLVHAGPIAGEFAVLAGFAGVAVLGLAVAIPFYHLPFGTWHFYLIANFGILGIWRNVAFFRHTKLARSRTLTDKASDGKSQSPR